MTDATAEELLEIVATLKDRVIEQEEKLETLRDQVALLTEMAHQSAPEPTTSRSVEVPRFLETEAA
ncbi:MAG: hypothetical protein ACRBBW_03920 [Cellvibrionaceae bacterium]